MWQQLIEIFLGQIKYVVEILKRFRMKDLKPMITNLRKIRGSKGELMDPILYG